MSRVREPVWEVVDPIGRFRVTVHDRSWDGLFEVGCWRRRVMEHPYGPPYGYWSPVGPPSLTDSQPSAQRLAKQRLEDLVGEPVDLTSNPITEAWVREASGDPTAVFVDPASVEVAASGDPVEARQIIQLSDLYLVREDLGQPDWWMGARH